jgi:hypothetical protein
MEAGPLAQTRKHAVGLQVREWQWLPASSASRARGSPPVLAVIGYSMPA